MLSKTELEFLKCPERFDADYRRVLHYRINSKAAELRREITLLETRGFRVTENCNGATEFCNGEQSPNQAALEKLMVARERFELSSAGPKPAMLVHYIRRKDSLPSTGLLRATQINHMFAAIVYGYCAFAFSGAKSVISGF
jgi:hypothetical protein